MSEPPPPEKPTVADMTAAYALDAIDHAKAAANNVAVYFKVLVEEYETKPKA